MSAPASSSNPSLQTSAAALWNIPQCTADQTDPAQLSRQLLSIIAPPKRAWNQAHSVSRCQLTVLSFLEGEIDDHFFGFFSQFADPLSKPPDSHDAVVFIRAKNINLEQDDRMVQGQTEALVLLGHCGKDNSLTSKPKEGRTFSYSEIMRYVRHFSPTVLVLVACEGGVDFRAPSLSKKLVRSTMEWTYSSVIGFACRAHLSADEATFGITGTFLFQLWAYLCASGKFAWHTRLLVELILDKATRVKAHIESELAHFTEYHALYMLSLFKVEKQSIRLLDIFSMRFIGRFTAVGSTLPAVVALKYCAEVLQELMPMIMGQSLELLGGVRVVHESELNAHCDFSRDKAVAFVPDAASRTLTVQTLMSTVVKSTVISVQISRASSSMKPPPPAIVESSSENKPGTSSIDSQALAQPARRSALQSQLALILSMVDSPTPYVSRERHNQILTFVEHVRTLLLVSGSTRKHLPPLIDSALKILKEPTSKRSYLSKAWRGGLRQVLRESVKIINHAIHGDIMFVLPPTPYAQQAARLPSPPPIKHDNISDQVQLITDEMLALGVSGVVVTFGASPGTWGPWQSSHC